MTQYQYLDELVREYLLFRGFTGTLKTFDADIKNEKEKGFRVDKIVDQISQTISSHDLSGLLELWKHFDTKLYSRLETHRLAGVRKLENSLYKLYIVSCVQSKQTEKLREFFEKMTSELHGQTEWKDWFALPYIKDPSDNPAFSLYFSRQWQDTLMMSLTNFLSIVFQSLPPPRLADYKKTSSRIRLLKEEIKTLKLRLAASEQDLDPQLSQGHVKSLIQPPTKENMDDFFLIAKETEVLDNQVKSLKSFLRNITGGGTNDRKKSPTSSKSRSSSKSRLVAPALPTSSLVSKSLPAARQQLKTASLSSIKSDQVPIVVCSNSSDNQNQNEETDVKTSNEEDTKVTEEIDQSKVKETSTNKYLLLGQDTYREHRTRVSFMSVSSVGGNIVSVDSSGVIKVWSSSPAPTTSATFISGSPVVSVCWVHGSDKYFLYGTGQGQVRLCDVQEKMSVAEVPGELLSGQAVSVLKSGPGPATFLLCSGIKILLMETGTCSLERDLSHPGLKPVTCAQFNHNGTVLIHAGIDGKLGMTDPNKGELLCVWLAHSFPVTSISLNSDLTGVWSLAEDRSLVFSSIIRSHHNKVWETLIPQQMDGAKDDQEAVRGTFSVGPDSDHILTNAGGTAAIFQLPPVTETEATDSGVSRTLALTKVEEAGAVTSVLWGSGDCCPALTGHQDGAVSIYTLLAQ